MIERQIPTPPESQVHQPTGRVVDDGGTLRAAILEPPVLGAVDLNELADAIAAMLEFVDRLETLPAVLPDPLASIQRRTVSTPNRSS